MIPNWYHYDGVEMKIITKKTDYAARALKYISNTKKKVTISEISNNLLIPKPFLRGIFQELEKAGIVRSYKGKSGGFELAKKADTIHLTDLINLFQGPMNFHECLIKDVICPDVGSCLLKEKIEKIKAYAASELGTITIESISKKEKKDGKISK